MTIEPAVLYGAMMSTWSLSEAAHYVHNLDPATSVEQLLPRSTSHASKTFYWLKKELDRGRIRPVVDEGDGEPRFIPGTIMRHLEDMKHGFHKPVLKAYLNHGVTTGPSDANKEAKFLYRKAATAIREQYPQIRKAQVAGLLTELPVHLKDGMTLPSFSAVTIRKHLKGLWTGVNGRPRKGEEDLPKLDWATIVKKLI